MVCGLECSYQAQSVSGGAGIDVVVDTAEYLRIKSVVLGDDEGVLNSAEHTQIGVVFSEVPGVTQSDVVTANEAGVAQPVVREVRVGGLSALEIVVGHYHVAQSIIVVGELQCAVSAQHIVIYVVAEAGAELEAQIPVLPIEVVVPGYGNFGILAVLEYAVIVVDRAVAVLIHVAALDGCARLVINLLIQQKVYAG